VGEVFLKIAGFLLGQVENVSRFIAQFPFSEILLPHFPLVLVGLFAFGLVAFCTFRQMGKGVAVILWLMCLIKLLYLPQPDLLMYNQTLAWVKSGQFFENSEGQKWIQNRWQKALVFEKATELFTPDFVWIQNQKIALKGTGCLGAKIALLSFSDTRCHIPTILLKPDTFYQVFVDENEIRIQEGDLSQQTIIP